MWNTSIIFEVFKYYTTECVNDEKRVETYDTNK